MKKILLIAATLLLAMSCNDWKNSNSEPPKAKIVDELIFADGHSVKFTYGGPNNLISLISYSTGRTIELSYEGVNTQTPTIYVNDGTTEQKWNVVNSVVRSIEENGAEVINMEYGIQFFYWYLTGLKNSPDLSRTTINWTSGAIPTEKITTWYANSSFSMDEQVARQLVRFGWNSSTAPTNWLASVDLLPFIVPEYTEGWGIDPAVAASAGVYCFRAYNLPSYVTVAMSYFNAVPDDDNEGGADLPNPTSDTRYFGYEVSAEGHMQAVYTINPQNNERTKLFEIKYAE